jgi:hypothetical protein
MPKEISFFYDYVLPNTVFPNATPVEMGVINYIHTLYTSKSVNGGIFNYGIETPHSVINTIFGQSMGMWPMSLGGSSHLQMRCYQHAISIKESSVYLGKRVKRKYIYPIKVTYHFDEFTGSYYPGYKINGEFFWKHISAAVLEDVKSKNAVILLDWANESLITKESFEKLHIGLKMSGIPKEQILLIMNGFNANEVYNDWFTPEEQCLEVINLPFLMSHTSYHYKNLFSDLDGIENFRNSKNKIRKHYFLFKIRRARDYRIAMLYTLASNNLLEKGNWSCLQPTSLENNFKQSLKYRSDINYEIVEKLHDQLPHRLDCEEDSNFNNIAGWTDQTTTAHDNSYFYIASETYMSGKFKFFTEKVFKPIANFQPFVFLSFPGALKELKRLGFKTFHPYIDESYDDEQDEVKRFNLIYDEIKRLCSMNIEELHNWYWAMEDVLIHNHNHLLSSYKTDPYISNLVKYLDEKTS